MYGGTGYWILYGVVVALFILALYSRWRWRRRLAGARAGLAAQRRPALAPQRSAAIRALNAMADALDQL
jgi:hypothetical protein